VSRFDIHNQAYEALPDIEDVKDISEEDAPCLEEVCAILSRYGAESKFGLCLLHKHFPLEPDEILAELPNDQDRTATSRPIKSSEALGMHLIEAAWRLDADEARPVLYRVPRDPDDVASGELSPTEKTCFREIKAVLEKYAFLERLGPCLLDKRFFAGMLPDEAVYERSDRKTRVSTIGMTDLRGIAAMQQETNQIGKRTLVTFDPALLEGVAPELGIYPADR